MNPDLDMQEVARLLELARDLLLLHRDEVPTVRFFAASLTRDAKAMRNLARHTRESSYFQAQRLFA